MLPPVADKREQNFAVFTRRAERWWFGHSRAEPTKDKARKIDSQQPAGSEEKLDQRLGHRAKSKKEGLEGRRAAAAERSPAERGRKEKEKRTRREIQRAKGSRERERTVGWFISKSIFLNIVSYL